jgi:chromosomal replication initiator protein
VARRESYKKIGAIFGGKDHTTILYAFRKIEVETSAKPEINNALSAIRKILEIKGIELKD